MPQFFDNNGNNIGTKFPITDGISAPDIASDGNNFFVSWQTWGTRWILGRLIWTITG